MACPVVTKIFHVRKAADRSGPALHQNDQIYIVWLVANILWPLVWWYIYMAWNVKVGLFKML